MSQQPQCETALLLNFRDSHECAVLLFKPMWLKEGVFLCMYSAVAAYCLLLFIRPAFSSDKDSVSVSDEE